MASCQKDGQKPDASKAAFIVLHVEGDAFLFSAKSPDEKSPLKEGSLVFAKDRLLVEKGLLDLQSRSGNAVRVRENTDLLIQTLLDQKGSKNVKVGLELKEGALFAKAKKGQSGDEFNVRTPTAVASVRGTSFSVSYREDRPNVRVIEGSVAMKPRIVGLDKLSAKEIEKNPRLKKLAELQKTEVVVESEKEAALSPALSRTLKKVNQRAEKEGVEAVKGEARNLPALDTEKALEEKKLRKRPEDIMDAKTLLTVDTKMFDELRKSVEAGKFDPKLLSGLEELRAEKRLEALQEIAKLRMEEQGYLPSDYSKSATIVLQDGTRLSGEILERTKDAVSIRTAQGLRRLPRKDIRSIE